MKAVAYIDESQQPWAVRWIHAFVEGARENGVDIMLRRPVDIIDCDLAVFWGHSKRDIIRIQRANGADYLCMEKGYIGDRWAQVACGLNGLNGHADFNNERSPPDRWVKYFDGEMLPWQFNRGHVLLAGQVPGDSAVRHYDLRREYQAIVDFLVDLGLTVVWRSHPLSKDGWTPQNVVNGRPQLPLATDLEGARALVCLNSNSSVEAVLAGIPAITLDDHAMAWDVAAHDLDRIMLPKRPDRRQWAYDLAYAQWSLAEIKAGITWRHLFQ